MDRSLSPLAEHGLPFWETSFSALDAYIGHDEAPVRFIAVEAGVVELVKALGELEFRGLPWADASLESGGITYHFRCIDSEFRADEDVTAFGSLDLYRVPGTRRFIDPRGVYENLRTREKVPKGAPLVALFESAVLISRYDFDLPSSWMPSIPGEMSFDAQRDLLALMLTSRHPERGLTWLQRAGFVAAFWPELEALRGTIQSKEHHPEGDAWDHTLETFQYRKVPDLALSLALLLHDAGKPEAQATDGKRFARHSEIGAGITRRFLSRLGFGASMIDSVCYLVRWHMLPAALPRLPVQAVREALEDRRFPLLLELYRCDELSTFKGPDGYYRACAVYREWTKNLRNPFRDDEGRKLVRLYVENAPRGSSPSAHSRRSDVRHGGKR